MRFDYYDDAIPRIFIHFSSISHPFLISTSCIHPSTSSLDIRVAGQLLLLLEKMLGIGRGTGVPRLECRPREGTRQLGQLTAYAHHTRPIERTTGWPRRVDHGGRQAWLHEANHVPA